MESEKNAPSDNVTESQDPSIYKDPTQSIEARVDDLVGRMTLEEKISQMLHNAPAIERLGVPAYNWWNECLHGVARAGVATVFPQAIGMAATWNVDLIHTVAEVIADAEHSGFVWLRVDPAADLDALRRVYIVKPVWPKARL